MIPAHTEVVPKQELVLNAHFRIEPCSNCFIAGYLIVSPRVQVSSLAELSPDAQNALGVTLAAATRAIDVVVHPRRVYCALFAEETGAVHFHLFPRTDWLLSSYSRAHPEDTVVSGPDFSTGHAQPSASLSQMTIGKLLTRFFMRFTKSSNQSLQPTRESFRS